MCMNKPSVVTIHDSDARIIWDYMHMNQPLEPAGAIFVLCSNDTRVAERAAELYEQHYADWVIVSGNVGVLTKDIFNKPEAEVFRDVLVRCGVPEARIILETKATNTEQNVKFVYALLRERNQLFDSLILVQKPFMERRTYATFEKQWPDTTTRFSVTSPQINYDDYMANSAIDRDFVISNMVGDLQRIREYPKRGFQTEQYIPEDVWQAFERLVQAGYDKHLI